MKIPWRWMHEYITPFHLCLPLTTLIDKKKHSVGLAHHIEWWNHYSNTIFIMGISKNCAYSIVDEKVQNHSSPPRKQHPSLYISTNRDGPPPLIPPQWATQRMYQGCINIFFILGDVCSCNSFYENVTNPKWRVYQLSTLRIVGGVTVDWGEKIFTSSLYIYIYKNRLVSFFWQTLLFYPIDLQVKGNERAESHGRPKQNRSSFVCHLTDAHWYICVPPAFCTIRCSGTLVYQLTFKH